jgi:hypothetical protein
MITVTPDANFYKSLVTTYDISNLFAMHFLVNIIYFEFIMVHVSNARLF